MSCIFKVCFLIPLMLLIITTNKLNAQINAESIDNETISKLVLEEVNKIRTTKKKGLLHTDSILQLAAQNQADFLFKKKKLTHFQSDKSFKTPYDRVLYYGRKSTYVAENVAFTSINIPMVRKNVTYINNSYPLLVKDFIDGWVNSAMHYENMINPLYTLSGIAISVDKDLNRVYIVQVFG